MKYKYLVIIPDADIVANLEDEFALATMISSACALNEDRIKNGEKIPALVFAHELELPGALTWRAISPAELRAIIQNMRR